MKNFISIGLVLLFVLFTVSVFAEVVSRPLGAVTSFLIFIWFLTGSGIFVVVKLLNEMNGGEKDEKR